jgi:hypothetical protein
LAQKSSGGRLTHGTLGQLNSEVVKPYFAFGFLLARRITGRPQPQPDPCAAFTGDVKIHSKPPPNIGT